MPRRVGAKIEHIGRAVEGLEPATDVEGPFGRLRGLHDAREVAGQDHG